MKIAIATVSLLSDTPCLIRSAYDGDNLVIAKLEHISKLVPFWRKNLAEKVKALVAEGVTVIVEEMTDHVAQHATHILLQDSAGDGRPYLAVGLDWYNALLDGGQIIFSKGTERARIPESSIDMQMDDKGRNIYKIAWRAVKGDQRSIILTCLAAEGMQVMDDSSIKKLFKEYYDSDSQEELLPQQKIAAALRAMDQQLLEEFAAKQGIL